MSDLTSIEKFKLEKFFGMETGYVLEFSNRTFQEFILENTNLDIYAEKYEYLSGSKANRLRAFWQKENNYTVGKLIAAFLELWRTKKLTDFQDITKAEELYNECLKIATRLKQNKIVEEIEVIREDHSKKDFNLLAKSIKESIEKNEPEAALDRLHTYMIKYIRQLCVSHNLSFTKEDSLNALFGKYVRFIVEQGYVESKMGEKILKYSIQILDAFNDIRNNKSFAHDNPILNSQESVLIFNNVTNSIRYIETIEEKISGEKKKKVKKENIDWYDLPS